MVISDRARGDIYLPSATESRVSSGISYSILRLDGSNLDGHMLARYRVVIDGMADYPTVSV
jgi:hypothetical protein